MSRRPALAALALAAVALVTGCSSGAPSSPNVTYPPGAIVISAQNLRFSTDQLVVPAGTKFTLVFENKEPVPHNVAISSQPDGKGDLLFRHDPITSSTGIFEVGPLVAGTYHFHCEVHPSMTGTVLAQ